MKTRFKAVWKEILAPDYNTGTDILMLIIEWMFKTGWKHQQYDYQGCGYKTNCGVFELLHGLSCVNSQYYYDRHYIPVEKAELLKYIQRAVLSMCVNSKVKEWRNKYKIGYDQQRIIPAINDIERCHFGLYDGRNAFDEKLEKLLSFKKKELNYSPNEFHLKAKYISSINFFCGESGLGCKVSYGFKKDYSSWDLPAYYGNDQYLPDWIDSIITKLDKIIQ